MTQPERLFAVDAEGFLRAFYAVSVPAAGLAAPAFARFSLPLDTALAQKATQQGGWLLALVQALGDAANLGLDQPPPSAPTDLLALVSGDNNLGLLRLPTSPVGGQA